MIKITKKSYTRIAVLDTIDTAIEMLCMENGRCTPTDVLRLALLDESKTTRRLVLERAMYMEYTIISSGQGYTILDDLGITKLGRL